MGELRKRKEGEASSPAANEVPPKRERFSPIERAAEVCGLPAFVVHLLTISSAIASYSYTCVSLTVLWVTLPLRIFNYVVRALNLDARFYVYDYLTQWWAQSIVFVSGSWPIVVGSEHVDRSQRTIYCSNHLSSSDTIGAIGLCPHACKLIYKKELIYYFPWMFVLAYLINHVPVDRKNRDSALQSMEYAENIILKKKNLSLFFFVEGTRSRSGQLQTFKKGAFHVAKSSGTPITPTVLTGSYEQWPPWTMLPVPGQCKIAFLEQIPVTNADTADTLMEKTRKAIAEYQQQDTFRFRPRPIRGAVPGIIWNVLSVIGAYLTYCYLFGGN